MELQHLGLILMFNAAFSRYISDVVSPQLKERKNPIFVSEKKGCHLCHNTFSEPDVLCLPGAVPVHTHCVAQRVKDSPTKRQLTNSSNHT